MQNKQANRQIFWTLIVIVSILSCVAFYMVFILETPPNKKTAQDPFVPSDFARIKSGSFMMGSNANDAYPDEKPLHRVTITKTFLISKTEVTQKQWSAIMDHDPSMFRGPNHPVDNVGWGDIQVFLNRLNKVARDCNDCYRLPTEAEWEYAARAGSSTSYSFGDNPEALDEYAWYASNAGFRTHPVAKKKPNAWGLYDTHGNVYEWVQDFYGPYKSAPAIDPQGETVGTEYILRGGSWTDDAREQRPTYRDYYAPNHRHNFFGFRLVRTKSF